MRVLLDPAHTAVHHKWLQEHAGGYEWWYFDAVSDDLVWSVTCIWLLGNPFSPYYRLAQHGEAADPLEHNALFFSLHKHGKLQAYHFTAFPKVQVAADAQAQRLQLGPNALDRRGGSHLLHVSDINGNGHAVDAELTFKTPGVVSGNSQAQQSPGDRHFWQPTAPDCRVSGTISLRGAHDHGKTQLTFRGTGYHDHNWGVLPFGSELREWYWARAVYPNDRAAVIYHLRYHAQRPPQSHLLLFERGRLIMHDTSANVTTSRTALNVFLTRYARQITLQSDAIRADFISGQRLDSSPFYIRSLCRSTLTLNGETQEGQGMAEYFRPRLLGSRLAASATKARIVVR